MFGFAGLYTSLLKAGKQNKCATASDFCGLIERKGSLKNELKRQENMKRLLLALLAAGLIGCAEQYAPLSATTGVHLFPLFDYRGGMGLP